MAELEKPRRRRWAFCDRIRPLRTCSTGIGLRAFLFVLFAGTGAAHLLFAISPLIPSIRYGDVAPSQLVLSHTILFPPRPYHSAFRRNSATRFRETVIVLSQIREPSSERRRRWRSASEISISRRTVDIGRSK
jgi:hypothetical protein